ncbi:hypothetical protein [Massilia glaciei]|uniref:Uncharacterized protein n=1 Tax=Massilia glaciei TaxID=1524097 RepID=A0A2U2HMC7_9BURK|nr:hypothetical protein [Massilia glaciei]PWF48674.1 hypothetical protein C7C56_010720 [Massilia glaciei]
MNDEQFVTLIGDSETDETIMLLSERGHKVYESPMKNYSLVALAIRAAAHRNLDPVMLLDWCESCLLGEQALYETEASTLLSNWQKERHDLYD